MLFDREKTYDNNIIITELSISNRYPFRLENVHTPQHLEISLDDNYSVISLRQNESLINVHDNVFYDETVFLIHLHPEANKVDTYINAGVEFSRIQSTKEFEKGYAYYATYKLNPSR